MATLCLPQIPGQSPPEMSHWMGKSDSRHLRWPKDRRTQSSAQRRALGELGGGQLWESRASLSAGSPVKLGHWKERCRAGGDVGFSLRSHLFPNANSPSVRPGEEK